jgi:hypothetical protein
LKRLLALFILRHFEKETRFFETRAVSFPSVDDRFKRGLFFQNDLCFVRIAPKIGTRGELIELVYALLLGFEVKDASAEVRGVLPGGRAVLWFLPTSISSVQFIVLLCAPLSRRHGRSA